MEILSRPGVEFEALKYDADEDRYFVRNFVDDDGNYASCNEEIPFPVATNYVRISDGTPVACHGLKNATHLNGKIGDTRRYDESTGRHEVHFDDKSPKSAAVKPENLRIVFDLPAEEAFDERVAAATDEEGAQEVTAGLARIDLNTKSNTNKQVKGKKRGKKNRRK